MAKTNDAANSIDATDEELIDTLIAISVVSKRPAAKLRQKQQNNESEEYANEILFFSDDPKIRIT